MAPSAVDIAYSPAPVLQIVWMLQVALREKCEDEKYFVAKLFLQYKYLEGHELPEVFIEKHLQFTASSRIAT